MKIVLMSFFLSGMMIAAHAQSAQDTIHAKSNFEEKFQWGVSYVQGWSTINGGTASYFTKPSLGVGIAAEYWLLKFVGVSIGAAYQQRGAGIKNTPSQTPVVAAVDSTYRERLRFNTLEIPISIMLRTPKDLIKGIRLSGSVSVVPIKNFSSHDVITVLEPTLKDVDVKQDVSSSYFTSDMAYQFSIGPEFAVGESGVVRAHFFSGQGTTNVFKTGSVTGHNQLTGIRVTVLF